MKCDIINELPQEAGRESQEKRKRKITFSEKLLKKVFEKSLKKDLTNERKCDIINKSSAVRKTYQKRHCILKSEQY